MEGLLKFARGPLFISTFSFMVLGLLRRVYLQVHELRKAIARLAHYDYSFWSHARNVLVWLVPVTHIYKKLEICLSLGIISAAALVFVYMAEYFEIFEFAEQAPSVAAPPPRAWWGRRIRENEIVTLCIALTVPVAAGLFFPDALQGVTLPASPVSAPRALDEARRVLRIDGNRNGDLVLFKHAFHEEKPGGGESCRRCHHLDLPHDKSSPCWKCHRDMFQSRPIFNHEVHEKELGGNRSCAECHDMSRPKNLQNSKPCRECHAEDMHMAEPGTRPFDFIAPPRGGAVRESDFMAPSYKDAMHAMCIGCHRKVAQEKNKPGMTECVHCHAAAWKSKRARGGNHHDYGTPRQDRTRRRLLGKGRLGL